MNPSNPSPQCLQVCNVQSFHLCLHTGNGYTGSKQYPESVVSDKQFPTSPIHVTPLRDPISKSTPLVSYIVEKKFNGHSYFVNLHGRSDPDNTWGQQGHTEFVRAS